MIYTIQSNTQIRFKYHFCDIYKSIICNKIVDVCFFPFDVAFFVFGNFTCFLFYNLPKFLFVNRVLNVVDDFLVPTVHTQSSSGISTNDERTGEIIEVLSVKPIMEASNNEIPVTEVLHFVPLHVENTVVETVLEPSSAQAEEPTPNPEDSLLNTIFSTPQMLLNILISI